MSTHNIGFYEDLTKIIFKLSSNIIKYAPYFFCWLNTHMPALRCALMHILFGTDLGVHLSEHVL